MAVVSLLPQSGLISRVGGTLQGQDGSPLTNTTGTGSPANYIKNGITSPDDTTYWANTTLGSPGIKTNFYVGVDKMTLSPSGLTFKVRGNINGAASTTLRDFEVWLRKEHNPSLVSDIQVASGLSTITINTFGNQNYTSSLRIIEANRSAFESGIPNNWMCISGIITFPAPLGSGNHLFTEMELELSGTFPTIFNSADLYIQGAGSSSGNVDLYTWAGPIPESGSTDLYTSGFSTGSGNTDLYTQGSILSSGSIDLFMWAGPIPTSGNTDFYTLGNSSSSGNCDLYIVASALASGDFTLYQEGMITSSGGMNLYTSGPNGISYSGQYVPLSIWSEANSGVFGQTNLTVYNVSTFAPQDAMNLVLGGVTFQTQTGSMNLIMGSDPSSNNQFNLYLCNGYSLSSGWASLYITTPSGTEGSVPLSGNMNLVMWRDYDSIAQWVPFTLGNGGSGNDNVSLYIYGNTVGNSSVPLYMYGVGPANNSAELYTHGF